MTSAIEREMRRVLAEQDASALREKGAADDLDALVDWTVRNVDLGTWPVREICLVHLDRTRPAVVLTREAARAAMSKVTVAPITTTVRGLSSEVPLGPQNGLDRDCVASIDNVLTVPADCVGRTIGFLSLAQEAALARAVVLAYDLDVPLLG